MTIKQAVSWLSQPGILAMIHDPTTKKAVQVAIKALSATDTNVGTKLVIDPHKIERAIRGLTEWQKHVQTESDIDRDISVAVEALKAQLSTNLAEVGTDCISRQAAIDALAGMIDRFERILADIRETKVDDSVCGMCEYDGAYIGQSGDWCNECPGFDKDNCFKLSDRCRKRWMSDITLPSAQPERTCVNCGRTANNGGWYADGETRCPIEEHYALPKDGFCHLWEKRNVTDDDYPERREE